MARKQQTKRNGSKPLKKANSIESNDKDLFVRSSGILLHPTSLSGPYGIGDIGSNALGFIDFLHKAGQTIWQFLPLTPHGHAGTPYASPSAMAANPCLISLEPLLAAGLITQEDTKALRDLEQEKVDYDKVTPIKRKLLRIARDNFRSGTIDNETVQKWTKEMHEFVTREGKEWLDDYALYMALREKEGKAWNEWEEDLKNRKKDSLDFARQNLGDAVDEHYFNQFLFDLQWKQVRDYAKSKNVRLIADIPIFVAYDSSDVWANKNLFKLDENGVQTVQAGVPPDYFSATGQLWGNPVYNWEECEKEKYKWWTLRFRRALDLADIIRIDHFRGFQAAWEVPIADKTAQGGSWITGPGEKLFRAVDKAMGKRLPVIAEDLGLITEEVHKLRDGLRYPGMKVLQFAWNNPESEHLPHQIRDHHCVIYTGTHDNNTVVGWANQSTNEERRNLREYLGIEKGFKSGEKRKREEENGTESEEILEDISWKMIQLAFDSVADTAIVQLQDILELDGSARMNTPATTDGNWSWRCKENCMTDEIADKLKKITARYGRLIKKE